MYRIRSWSGALMLALGGIVGMTVAPAAAQQAGGTGTITGRITDGTTARPLPGATVTVVGTGNTTLTAADGRFLIVGVPAGEQRVRARVLGYGEVEQRVTVTPGATATVNFELREEAIQLEEIVAIGYGEVRQQDLTGSVASVPMEDPEERALISLEQAMQGRIAGALVTQTDAGPGGGLSVQIRGAGTLVGGTEPLYVIDGVPIPGGNDQPRGETAGPGGQSRDLAPAPNMLNFLNPNDIESIEVLKDASATAIYGSRGANGVVLITTKQGTSRTPRITFNFSTTSAAPERTVDVLDAAGYARYRNELEMNRLHLQGLTYEEILERGLPFPGAENANGEYMPSPADFSTGAAPSTDWQDAVFRRADYISNLSLGVQGSFGANSSYYLSGSYQHPEGIIHGSDFERYTLKGNLDAGITDRLTLRNRLTASGNFGNRSQTHNAHFGPQMGVVASAMRYPPHLTIGNVFEQLERGETASDDPFTLATAFVDKRSDYNLIESVELEYRLTDALAFNSKAGVSFFGKMRDMYYPLSTAWGRQELGRINNGYSQVTNLINENWLSYDTDFGNHSVTAIGGFTQEQMRTRDQFMYVRGFENDLLSYYSMQSARNQYPPLTSYASSALQSGLTRVNYNYDDRYLLTLSARADGSSKFGANNQWGFFPSAAFAWRLSEESFMRGVDQISNLKLRLSYGETGNTNLQPYQSLARLAGNRVTLDGQQIVLGYQNALIENPDLRWETTRQINAGIDVGLFDQRLTITADAYRKNTSDLLQQILLPLSSGYGFQTQNRGALESEGLELGIGADLVRTTALNWHLNANAFTNSTKITDLGGPEMLPGRFAILHEWYPFKLYEGRELGTIYGYETDGVFTSQAEVDAHATQVDKAIGEFRLRDQNNDGVINAEDETIIGNTNPAVSFGLSNDIRYGNIDLSVFAMGSLGQDMLNLNYRANADMNSGNNQFSWVYENAFRPEIRDAAGNVVQEGNPDGTWHMPGSNRRPNSTVLDMWVEDASYMKIKSITLGYSFANPWAGFRDLRIYGTMNNVFTFTDYTGYDPEASLYGQDPLARGIDFGSYPPARSLIIGFSMGM